MISATSFLTIFGRAEKPTRNTLLWFPVVGLLVGLVVGSLWWLAGKAWPALPSAAVVLVADLLLTGLLHFDGLADAADGLVAPLSRERRLEAMADPAIGAFGVVVVGAVLILRFSSFAVLRPTPLVIGGLWCASRTVMATLTDVLPYVRPSGLVKDFLVESRGTGQRVGSWTVWVTGVVVAAVLMVVGRGVRGLVALGAELLAMAVVATLASKRIGGYTGDVLGAAGVVGETVGLLVLAMR
jgi:adenosylcobinamide-GDP ribazoletransferase